MRKIVLSPNDYSLFGHEISPIDYEYFVKHKAAFRRMWIEQGQKFWFMFLVTFKKFAKKNILISPLPQIVEDVRSLSDVVFTALVTEFTLGKQNQAKRLIDDIINVARNRHSIQYLESKSLAKDPFYHKETRDAFRNLFGEPNDRISYAKVYLYLVMYLKFGGSVMECLRLWLKAEEWTPDHGFFIPHYEPGEFDLGIDGYIIYLLEKNHGCASQPVYIQNWTHGHPRLYQHDKNPLFNTTWSSNKDWRDDLSLDLFQRFMVFIYTFQCTVCRDTTCEECKRIGDCLNHKKMDDHHCPECDNDCKSKRKEDQSNESKRGSTGKKKKDAKRVETIRILDKKAKAISLLKDLSPKDLLNVKDFMLGPELELYTEDDFVCTDDEYETVEEEEEVVGGRKNLDTAIDVLLNPPTATNLPRFNLEKKSVSVSPVSSGTSGERGEDDQAVIAKSQVTKSVSDIADIVNDMADRVTDVVTRVNDFASKTQDDQGIQAKTTVQELRESVKKAKDAVGKAQGSVEKNETVDEAKTALMDAIQAMKTANDLTGKAADTVERWRDCIGSAHDVVGKANQTIEKTEDTIKQTKDTIEKTKDKMMKTRHQIEQSKLANELMRECFPPLTDEELLMALFGKNLEKMEWEGRTERKEEEKRQNRIKEQHRQYLDEGLRSMLPPGLIPDNQLIIDASLPLNDIDIGRTVSIATEDKTSGDRLVYTITFPRGVPGADSGASPADATVQISQDVDLFNQREDWTRASDCFQSEHATAALESSLKLNNTINERIRERVLEEVGKNTSLSEEMKRQLIDQVEKQVFKEVFEHASRREGVEAPGARRTGVRRKKRAIRELKRCFHCNREEGVVREFKKCQMCKEVGTKNTRYYCSKDCQVLDWKAKHRQEHSDNQV